MPILDLTQLAPDFKGGLAEKITALKSELKAGVNSPPVEQKTLLRATPLIQEQELTLQGLDTLDEKDIDQVMEALNDVPYFTQFKIASDTPKLAAIKQQGEQIAERNKLLQINSKKFPKVDIDLEKDDLWDAAVKVWRTAATGSVGTVIKYYLDRNDSYFHNILSERDVKLYTESINNCLKTMGVPFQKRCLRWFLEEKEYLKASNFQYTGIAINEETDLDIVIKNHIAALSDNITSLPFKELTIHGISDDTNTFDDVYEKLILKLPQSPVEKINVSIDFQVDEKEISKYLNKILTLVKKEKIKTTIKFEILEMQGNEAQVKLLQDISNAAAYNQREHRKELRRSQINKDPEIAQPPNISEDALEQKSIVKKGKKRASKQNALAKLQTQTQVVQQQQEQQQQQQQEQQQQQQQQQALTASGVISSTKNLVNISTFAVPGGFCSGQFSAFHSDMEMSEGLLKSIWANWVGKDADNLEQAIKWMTPSAVRELSRFDQNFQAGLNIDNLPEGFFLEKITKENQKEEWVLNYDRQKEIENKNHSPLTIRCINTLPKRDFVEIKTTIGQFGLESKSKYDLKDPLEFKPKNTLQKREHLYKLMRAEDSKLAPQLITKYKSIFESFNDNHMIRIAEDILTTEGCLGVEVLLKNLATIKSLDFNENTDQKENNNLKNRDTYTPHQTSYYMFFLGKILSNSPNWLEFINDDTTNTLKKIAELPLEKREWWIKLSSEHFQNSKSANLADLFSGFEYFCQEYENITHSKLPLPCEIRKTKNMKVCMDRMLAVLKQARQSNQLDTQIEAIQKIDLNNSNGAYYAIRYENYNFVIPEMGFSNIASGQFNSKYTIIENDLIEAAAENNVNPADMEIFIYRYLGQQTYISTIDKYREIIKYSFAPSKASNFLGEKSLFDSETVPNYKKFITLLTLCTAHKRGYETNITEQMKIFVEMFDAKEEAKKGLILDKLLTWQNPHENLGMPRMRLEEAIAVAQILREVKPEEFERTTNLIQQLIKNYQEPFLQALTNRRLNLNCLSTSEFLNLLERKEDNIPNEKLALVLALIDKTGYAADQGTELLNTLNQLSSDNNIALNTILDHLTTIEIAESKKLPTTEELITVIKKAPLDKDPNEICEFLTTQLSGCVFKSIPTIKALPFDMNQIVSGILNNLSKLESLGMVIDVEKLVENPLNYLANLYTGLNSFKKGLLNTAIGGKLHDLIAGQIDQQIESLKKDIDDKQQIALGQLVHKKLNPAGGKDIGEILIHADEYVKQTHKLSSALSKIKNIWPILFDNKPSSPNILNILNDCKQLGPKTYNIEFLTSLLETITEAYTHKPRFPHELLGFILNHPQLIQIAKSNSDKELFIKSAETILSHEKLGSTQKRSLINIAFYNAQAATFLIDQYQQYPTATSHLMTLFEKDPTVISALLNSAEKVSKIFNNTEDKSINKDALFKNFVNLYINNPTDFNIATTTLTQCDETKQLAILTIVAQGANDKYNQKDIVSLIKKLEDLKPEQLENLKGLYLVSPIPSLSLLHTTLNEPNPNIAQYIQTHQTNPYNNRNLQEQFDTANVLKTIEAITDLTYDRSLLYTQRHELYQWFTAVNSMGKDHPVLERKDKNSGKPFPSAKDLTTEEMRKLAEEYREIVKNGSPENITRARLAFLALAREAMYRSTGRFPNSTQILSVLSAIQQGGNVLSQIATGEGKGLITALYASMLWLEGKTVDVCTSNSELAGRDLQENTPYFDYLGIKHSTKNITATSNVEEYIEDGINYSDVAQLSLFRARTQIEKQHKTIPASLVLDEADFTLLDDKTRYRYAADLSGKNYALSPDAWIYEALNNFIDSSEFTNSEATAEDDIKNAIIHLKLQAKSDARKDRLKLLTSEDNNKQINTWLDAALAAKQLKPDVHYVVREEKKGEDENQYDISVARLIIDNRISADAQYSNGVQQFLHARLERNRKLDPKTRTQPVFEITPEVAPLASTTSKNFVDYYTKNGQVWGMTGTIGSAAERQEFRRKFNFKMQNIPTHKKKLRVDKSAILANSEKDYLEKIKKQIVHRLRNNEDPPPMLIVCKDIEAANAMHNFIAEELKKTRNVTDKYKLQYYDGKKHIMEGIDQGKINESKVTHLGGIAGMITVTTSILGRGSDFKPRKKADADNDKIQNHPKGLFVMQTFLGSERSSGQIVGRSGRQGHIGETMTIVNQQELLPKHSLSDMRGHEEKLSSRERAFREHQGDVINFFFNEFVNLYNSINDEETRTKLLIEWKKFLEHMEHHWDKKREELSSKQPNDSLLQDLSSSFIAEGCSKWKEVDKTRSQPLTLEDVQLKIATKSVDIELPLKEKYRPIKESELSINKVGIDFSLLPEDSQSLKDMRKKSVAEQITALANDLMKNQPLKNMLKPLFNGKPNQNQKIFYMLAMVLKATHEAKVESPLLKHAHVEIMRIVDESKDNSLKRAAERAVNYHDRYGRHLSTIKPSRLVSFGNRVKGFFSQIKFRKARNDSHAPEDKSNVRLQK